MRSPFIVSRAAEELTQLTQGRLQVRYEPQGTFDDDPGSEGHLYSVRPAPDVWDDLEMTLDDRRGDLPEQLAAELRRVARVYLGLADGLQEREAAAA